MHRYTEKERAFITLYTNNRDDKIGAYLGAGYSDMGHLNAIKANDILRKPKIQEAIKEKTAQLAASKGLDTSAVLEHFMEIYHDAMEASDLGNANRAMENIGKYLGMFIERKEVDLNKGRPDPSTEEETDREIKQMLKDLAEDDNLLESLVPEGNG